MTWKTFWEKLLTALVVLSVAFAAVEMGTFYFRMRAANRGLDVMEAQNAAIRAEIQALEKSRDVELQKVEKDKSDLKVVQTSNDVTVREAGKIAYKKTRDDVSADVFAGFVQFLDGVRGREAERWNPDNGK